MTTPPAGAGEELIVVETDNLTISRVRSRNGWRYIDERGKTIREADEIERLNRIAFPPAYTQARFCADPWGHIQAIGIDARGRRQYRYHAELRSIREQEKFGRCLEFGLAVPKLRRQLRRDPASPPASRQSVIGSVVSILDMAFIRIRNENHAKANKSFGLTTLRNRHAKVTRSARQFEFRAMRGLIAFLGERRSMSD